MCPVYRDHVQTWLRINNFLAHTEIVGFQSMADLDDSEKHVMEEYDETVTVEEETEEVNDEVDDDESIGDEEAHCSKYGCRYFLLAVAILYLSIICMACYFMYLGRFSVLRGFGQVKKTYNSFTFSNLKLVVTGRDPIYMDEQ